MQEKEKVSLRQQMEAWEKGEYVLYPHCNDFYDWFCKETSLPGKSRKLQRMVKKLIAVLQGPSVPTPVDLDEVYVCFKNNCPVNGPLYDSFSICSRTTGDVLYWVTGKSGHTGLAEIYCGTLGWDNAWQTGSTFTEVLKMIKDSTSNLLAATKS